MWVAWSPKKEFLFFSKQQKSCVMMGFSFHLALIGDGAERETLEREARRLGLQDRITFMGYLSGAAFEEAVRALRVVVMPSQWEETAGLAVMEKMMRGGLVVVADIGGLSEVVGDAGLKFAPGDVETLYSQLRLVLENPSIVATVRSAARARALKHFNRDSHDSKSYRALSRSVVSMTSWRIEDRHRGMRR